MFQSNTTDVFGAISEIETFTRDGRHLPYLLLCLTDEIGVERKLFTIPGRSYAQSEWDATKQTLTVDTTLGFRDNNEFITADGTVFTYEERTVNQFLGVTCADPTKTIGIGDEIIDNIVISGTNNDGDTVSLRLTGVISSIDFGEGVPFTTVGEKIRVDTVGENILAPIATRGGQTYKQIVANSFIYNTSVRFEVFSLAGTVFTLKASYLDNLLLPLVIL